MENQPMKRSKVILSGFGAVIFIINCILNLLYPLSPLLSMLSTALAVVWCWKFIKDVAAYRRSNRKT